MPRFTVPTLFMLAAIAPGIALAQAPDTTGTGGGPGSTVTAPNTTSVGQTKPPSGAAAPGIGDTERSRDELEQGREQNRRLEQGICKGC